MQGLIHSCLWYWSKDIMPGDVAAVLQPWGNKRKRMVKLKGEKGEGFGWAHLIAKAVSAAASYQMCYKCKLLFSWIFCCLNRKHLVTQSYLDLDNQLITFIVSLGFKRMHLFGTSGNYLNESSQTNIFKNNLANSFDVTDPENLSMTSCSTCFHVLSPYTWNIKRNYKKIKI